MIEECQLKDIRQFGEGLWFPLEVDRMAMLRSDPGPDAKEDELKGAKMYTLRYALSIDKNADGEPLLRVNHDIPDEKFKGKLIALAAQSRHRDRVYRSKRARAGQGAKKKKPRNRPHQLGLRSRKRKLKKGRR